MVAAENGHANATASQKTRSKHCKAMRQSRFRNLNLVPGRMTPRCFFSCTDSATRIWNQIFFMLTSLKCHWMIRADFASAWSRCLPVWRASGGSNDWRGILGRPFYSQSFSCRLAKKFASKFTTHADELLEKTKSNDKLNVICVMDVLSEMGKVSRDVRNMITQSEIMLPQSVCQELEDDANDESSRWIEHRKSFDTVGSYYLWAFRDVE